MFILMADGVIGHFRYLNSFLLVKSRDLQILFDLPGESADFCGMFYQ